MLRGHLYTLEDLLHSDGITTASLLLNSSHSIFEGHYPSQPVLPGAAILQIVKETLCLAIDNDVMLIIANNLKFLSMIDPASMAVLKFNLTYQDVDGQFLKVNATLHFEEKVCFKFKGSFRRI
jgi:3-hydroxyacyl-[acyl-carrier-protein] dehydratase